MHLLLKSEVPVVEEPPPPTIMEGAEVIVVDCPYSCVRIGASGVIEQHMPGQGYAVKVKTFHTGLFGGGTFGSEGTYFFEYGQIIESPDIQDCGDTTGAS